MVEDGAWMMTSPAFLAASRTGTILFSIMDSALES